MNRRWFLKSAVLASTPLWLRNAFAAEPAAGDCSQVEGPGKGARQVAAAYRRATLRNKPILVIVIPEDDARKWESGGEWGALLNFGSEAQLAPFALAEVVCATMSDLRKIVPTAIQGEPTLAVVETGAVPAQVRAARVELEPYLDRWSHRGERSWEEIQREENAIADRNIDRLAEAVRNALIPDGRAVDDAALAETARAELKLKPPAGSRWANSGGCGVLVEDDDYEPMMACGMGSSPPKSRRFLYFFAQTPGDRFREAMKRRENGHDDQEE